MTILRHYRLCPHSRSIRMMLAELGFDVSLIEDKPWTWSEELLAVNPSGDLPVLESEDGGILCGAYAISEWLSDNVDRDEDAGGRGGGRAPGDNGVRHGRGVIPGDILARAEVRRLVDWFHGKMHREATTHLLEEKVYGRFRGAAESAPDAETLRNVLANIAYHMRYLDHLADSRKWLAGDELSYADFAAAGHISAADYLGAIDWKGHEAAHLWYARIKSRPSVRAILEERVPGAPVPPAHYDDPDF